MQLLNNWELGGRGQTEATFLVQEFSTERQERQKRFALEFFLNKNPFLFKPHFYLLIVYFSNKSLLSVRSLSMSYSTLHRKLQRAQMRIMIGILTEVCLSHIYDFCL